MREETIIVMYLRQIGSKLKWLQSEMVEAIFFLEF